MTAAFDRYITQSEERQLFGVMRQHGSPLAKRDLAWMQLARNTGIRLCVLTGLTVDDARKSLREKRLVIRGEINKNKRPHKVFLNLTARKAVLSLLRVRKAMGHPEIEPDAPLIVSRNGKGMCARNFQMRMKMWAKRAGLTVPATPHWWRHTLAKQVMKTSTHANPLLVVQDVLGHQSINSTAIYTTPDREDVESALDMVG